MKLSIVDRLLIRKIMRVPDIGDVVVEFQSEEQFNDFAHFLKFIPTVIEFSDDNN